MVNPIKNETFKIILAVVGSALLTVFLCLALFPSLISTSWGNAFATKLINSQIPGKVQFKSLNTSWFGKQKIEDLHLYDVEGNSIAHINEFTATSNLFTLLTHYGQIGVYDIKGLSAHVIQYKDGTSNLQDAIHGKNESLIDNNDSPLSIFLSDVDLTASINEKGEKNINLKGLTRQQNLEGSFSAHAKIAGNAKNTQELLENTQLEAKTNNFPIRLLDEILALSDVRYKGLLLSAFGDKLNLSLDQQKNADGIGLKLNLDSPLIKGTINALLKNDRLVISDKDSLEWTIRPEFVSLLNELNTSDYKVTLTKPTKGLLSISNANIVYDNSSIDLLNTFATINLNVDQADFVVSDPIGNITLKGLNFTVDAKEKKDNIHLRFDALTEIAGDLSKISANADFSKAVDFQNISTLNGSHFNLNVYGIPLGTINHFLKQSPEMLTIVGKNLEVNAEVKIDNPSLVTIKLNSEKIKSDPIVLSIDDNFKLINPFKIKAILPHSILKTLNLEQSNFVLQNDVSVELLISNLLFPKSSLKHTGIIEILNDASLSGNIGFGQADILGLLDNNPLSFIETKIDFSAKPSLQKTALLSTKVESKDNKFQKIMGTNAALNVASTFDLKSNKIESATFTANVKSPTLSLDSQGRLNNLNQLFITKPTVINYQLNPDAVIALGLDDLRLENQAIIYGTIEPNQKAIELNNVASMQLKGLIQVNQIDLYGNAGSIKNLILPWDIDAINNKISLQVNGLTNLNFGRNEGSISGNLNVSNWINDKTIDLTGASINTLLNLVNFPVSFLEKISAQNDLINLIGSSINVNIEGDLSSFEKRTGLFNLNFNSDGLEGKGTFEYKEDVAISNINNPATIKYLLTPDRFQALRKRLQTPGQKQNYIIITSPSEIRFDLKTINIPLHQKSANLLKSQIVSEFSLNKLEIENPNTRDHVTLTGINGSLNSPEFSRDLKFNLQGQHAEKNSRPLPFSLNGTAKNLFNESGVLDVDNLTVNLNGQLEQFPVRLLGQFANLDDGLSRRISAVMGDKINAKLNVQIDHMQGPVAIEANGANGSFSLDSYVRNGILTLNKDFTTQVKMTEALGQEVLSEIFPLASGLIGADNPLTINVEANGFSLPLKNFNFNSLNVKKASLSLGKVYFHNSGQLGSILSLFNTSKSDKIAVWFTPLYINMQAGVININRIDLLIMDNYPIATWGKVDFIKDRVDMMIGLTGQALKNGFNLNGLGKNYILQIPFTGPVNNPSIDKKRASAKIAAIVASNRGPEGLLIGTALNIASGGLKEGKAPEPTTNPLPWSTGDDEVKNNKEETDSTTPESDKKKKKKKPIHSVEETAGKIIQNLLPF